MQFLLFICVFFVVICSFKPLLSIHIKYCYPLKFRFYYATNNCAKNKLLAQYQNNEQKIMTLEVLQLSLEVSYIVHVYKQQHRNSIKACN